MRERAPILCVDDEPAVLEGLQDLLRRTFDVHTATSGPEALELLKRDPERFKIVISDMRMPVMSGAAFLAEVRRIAPKAVRMLLTGQTDLGAAVKAVNDGQIFRFLSKPCGRDELLRACAGALSQHKLVTTRDGLLDELTVRCVGSLATLLQVTAPRLHDRGMLAQELATSLLPEDDERLGDVSAAALLGVLGEQDGRRVLTRIPRLESAAALLSQAIGEDRPDGPLPPPAAAVAAVLELDRLRAAGASREGALEQLHADADRYGGRLLTDLDEAAERADRRRVRTIRASELEPGMTLVEDLRTASGGVLVPSGTSIDGPLLDKLRESLMDHGGAARVAA